MFSEGSRIFGPALGVLTAALVSLALTPTVLQAAPGDVDSTFNPPPNLVNSVKQIIALPGGESLWLGSFNHPQLGERKLIWLDQGGGLASTFTPPELLGEVSRMAVQASGAILLAGRIEEVNGQDRGNLVRLKPDGTVDLSFQAGAGPVREDNATSTSSVTDLLVDDQDRIFLSGDFDEYSGEPVGGVLRLSVDGALQFAYDYGVGARVLSGAPFGFVRVAHSEMIVDQVDDEGGIDPVFNLTVDRANPSIITGVMSRASNSHLLFGTANNSYPFGQPPLLLNIDAYGRSQPKITRADMDFGPSGTAAFSAGTIDAAGRLVIGGNFDSVLSVSSGNLVRLLPNGLVDETFTADADGLVLALATGSTGGYLVGGSFTTINGTPAGGIARLRDNDSSASVAFVVAAHTVIESDNFIRLGVLRQGTTNNAVSVRYATEAGTAVEAVDFVAAEETLQFAPGERIKDIVIDVVNDETFREERMFSVVLSDPLELPPGDDPVGWPLGSVTHTEVTIVDDDDAIGFVGEDVTVVERMGNVVLEVVRLNTNFAFKVPHSLVKPDSLEVVDLTGGAIEFERGIASKELKLYVADDAEAQDEQTFDVVLAPNPPVTGGPTLSRTITVIDDDAEGYPGLGFSGPDYAIADAIIRDSAGRLVVGGAFTRVNGFATTNLVRFLPNGQIDTEFLGGFAGLARPTSLSETDGGKLLVGGFASPDAPYGLARLNADGSVDETFAPAAAGGSLFRVFLSAPLPNGNVVAVGTADTSGRNNTPVNVIDVEGSRNVAAESMIVDRLGSDIYGFSIADGLLVKSEHIYVGRPAASSPESALFRLSHDGALDESFVVNLANTNGVIFTTALADGGDGRVVVAGVFTSVDGVPRGSIAMFHEASGAIDESFATGTGANGWIRRVYPTPQGGYIIVGGFTEYDGQPRNLLARIDGEGALDESFDPGAGPDGYIEAAWPEEDGSVFVGGNFSMWNDIPSPGFVHLDSSGKLILTEPKFLNAQRTDTDQLSLELEVQPDVDVRVLRSTDLENWSPVSTNRTARRVLPVQLQTLSEDREFFQAERLEP